VLTPNAGDYVQAMKAGIMETADIYVVNKADQPNADRVVAELLGVLPHLPDGRRPDVLMVRQDEPGGITRLDEALQAHFSESGEGTAADRRRERQRFRVRKLLQRRLHEVLAGVPTDVWNAPLRDVYDEVLRAMGSPGDR
jgi:LAO/AO transport system kinase